MAPALPDIALHYHITSQTEIAATLSVFLITFAIGPLFLAPLSEIYGRTWVRRKSCRVSGSGIHAPKHLGTAYRQPGVPWLQFWMCLCTNSG